MNNNSILKDLALGHYTSAYDTEFLDKYSKGNIMFVSIGRMIDACSDFKPLKTFIGNNPEEQIETIQNILDFMNDNASTVGINVYDAIDMYCMVACCMYDEYFEQCIGRKPTYKEFAAICAKVPRHGCSIDYVLSIVQSVAEEAEDF